MGANTYQRLFILIENCSKAFHYLDVTRPPCQHQTEASRTGLINEGVKDLTHGKHFLHPRSGSGKDVS